MASAVYFDKYVVQRTLGEGSYGKVKLARDMVTGELVALKILKKEAMKKQVHITRVKREVRIMRLLSHPNIAKLIDVSETDKEIILAMEYINGGELFNFIVSNGSIEEETARKFFRQCVSALDYCHRNSVIHRDLKPENLLLDENLNIKMVDFGFVNMYDPLDLLSTFCGSPFYASPEMVTAKDYVGPEVDIWSLGVVLFTMLSGRLPFHEANTVDLCNKIATADYKMPEDFSEDAKDLIRRMLTVEPRKRISMQDIRTHPWVCKGFFKPLSSKIPERPMLSPNSVLDPEILEKMKKYGFGGYAAPEKVIIQRTPPNSVYFLVKEHLERKNRQSRKSHSETPKIEEAGVLTVTNGSARNNPQSGRNSNLRQRRLSMGVPNFSLHPHSSVESNEAKSSENGLDLSKGPISFSYLQKPVPESEVVHDTPAPLHTLPKSRKFSMLIGWARQKENGSRGFMGRRRSSSINVREEPATSVSSRQRRRSIVGDPTADANSETPAVTRHRRRSIDPAADLLQEPHTTARHRRRSLIGEPAELLPEENIATFVGKFRRASMQHSDRFIQISSTGTSLSPVSTPDREAPHGPDTFGYKFPAVEEVDKMSKDSSSDMPLPTGPQPSAQASMDAVSVNPAMSYITASASTSAVYPSCSSLDAAKSVTNPKTSMATIPASDNEMGSGIAPSMNSVEISGNSGPKPSMRSLNHSSNSVVPNPRTSLRSSVDGGSRGTGFHSRKNSFSSPNASRGVSGKPSNEDFSQKMNRGRSHRPESQESVDEMDEIDSGETSPMAISDWSLGVEPLLQATGTTGRRLSTSSPLKPQEQDGQGRRMSSLDRRRSVTVRSAPMDHPAAETAEQLKATPPEAVMQVKATPPETAKQVQDLVSEAIQDDDKHRESSQEKPEKPVARNRRRSSFMASISSALKRIINPKHGQAATQPVDPSNPQPREFAESSLWNLECKSTLSLQETRDELVRIALQNNIRLLWVGNFVVNCVVDDLEFEIEVCRLRDSDEFGLVWKRVRGNGLVYESMCREIVGQWQMASAN